MSAPSEVDSCADPCLKSRTSQFKSDECFCPCVATSSALARLEQVIGGAGVGWENHSQSSGLVAACAGPALCWSKPVVRYMGTLRPRRLSQQCAQRQGRRRRADRSTAVNRGPSRVRSQVCPGVRWCLSHHHPSSSIVASQKRIAGSTLHLEDRSCG